jgi:hypothetical protein
MPAGWRVVKITLRDEEWEQLRVAAFEARCTIAALVRARALSVPPSPRAPR